MRQDCHVCRSEGFEAQARVRMSLREHYIIATLNVITSDLLEHGQAGLRGIGPALLGWMVPSDPLWIVGEIGGVRFLLFSAIYFLSLANDRYFD